MQICDYFDTLLLVSNFAKCILCNTESEEFKQVIWVLLETFWSHKFSFKYGVYRSYMFCLDEFCLLNELQFKKSFICNFINKHLLVEASIQYHY